MKYLKTILILLVVTNAINQIINEKLFAFSDIKFERKIGSDSLNGLVPLLFSQGNNQSLIVNEDNIYCLYNGFKSSFYYSGIFNIDTSGIIKWQNEMLREMPGLFVSYGMKINYDTIDVLSFYTPYTNQQLGIIGKLYNTKFSNNGVIRSEYCDTSGVYVSGPTIINDNDSVYIMGNIPNTDNAEIYVYDKDYKYVRKFVFNFPTLLLGTKHIILNNDGNLIKGNNYNLTYYNGNKYSTYQYFKLQASNLNGDSLWTKIYKTENEYLTLNRIIELENNEGYILLTQSITFDTIYLADEYYLKPNKRLVILNTDMYGNITLKKDFKIDPLSKLEAGTVITKENSYLYIYGNTYENTWGDTINLSGNPNFCLLKFDMDYNLLENKIWHFGEKENCNIQNIKALESSDELIVYGYCGDSLYICKLSQSPVNVNSDNNLNTDHITISPNPATDYIEINIPKNMELPEINNAGIYNLFALRLKSAEVNRNEPKRIGISDLPVGIYFLKINNQVLKFIKY